MSQLQQLSLARRLLLELGDETSPLMLRLNAAIKKKITNMLDELE